MVEIGIRAKALKYSCSYSVKLLIACTVQQILKASKALAWDAILFHLANLLTSYLF